jgi:hypothetical protein
MQKAHKVESLLSLGDDIPNMYTIDRAVKRARYPEISVHLRKLRDDLHDWWPHAAKNAMTPRQIIRGCLLMGPDFFDYYKSEVREAMYRGVGAREPITCEYIYGPPDKDYWDGPDSWFDMRFTIFWDLKSDDAKYMFTEDGEDTLLDEGMLESFKFSLMSILPEEIRIKESVSSCFNVGSAKSFDPEDPDKKRIPEWLECYGETGIDEGPPINYVKGVQIPKCAGETRDGVTIPPLTKRCLTKVGKAISQILSKCAYKYRHPTGMSYEQVDGKLQHLAKKYAVFLCQDFEKIGLTLPTHIVVEVLDLCYSISEYEPFLEAKTFFKELQYHNGTEYQKTLRGYCLGLLNEGMTLVQLALHHMVCSDLSTDHDGIFLNDDAVVGFQDREFASRYAESDATICLGLGIPRKDTKSFMADGFFVFCEEYYREEVIPKTVLRKCAYNSCYYMPTIHRAKMLFCSIAMNMGLDESKLEPLVEYWGYEFYEGEHLSSYEFGGWHYVFENGYNTACVYYDNDSFEYWAYHALKQTLHHKGKIGKRPTQPLSRHIRASMGEPIEEPGWKPLTKIENLFGDKRAISFYRMQTDGGRDNSEFFTRIEQKKVKEYFSSNMRTLPPTSLVQDMIADGYMPPFNHIDLEPLGDHIEFQGYGVNTADLENARLAIDLRHLGVVYNHPVLNGYSYEVSMNMITQNLVNGNIIPIKGILSPELTESNVKLINFCYDKYQAIPKLDYTCYKAAFISILGVYPDKEDFCRFMDQHHATCIEDITRFKEMYFDEVMMKQAEEPEEVPEASDPEEPPKPTIRRIPCRNQTTNVSGSETMGDCTHGKDVIWKTFNHDATDFEILMALRVLGLIPIINLDCEVEVDDDPMDSLFSDSAKDGDY